MIQSRGCAIILVTGMSGTGKSSALAELERRGHRVIDTDDPGWITQAETANGSEPLWDAEPITNLLDRHRPGWLFIAGCVANQGIFSDRFAAVVLLSAPLDILLARVADRANPFGSQPEQRAKIATDLAEFEPKLRAGADHEIDTTKSIPDVATALEQIAAGVQQRPDASG